MKGKALIGLAILLLLSSAFPEEVEKEQSDILQKIRDLEQRVNRLEQELLQLREKLEKAPPERQVPKEPGPFREGAGPELHGDPQKIWQAMGDPEELTKRLNNLAEAFAPTLSDEKKRAEFLKDVENLKEKIGKKRSEEELYKALWDRLSERVAQTPSKREKAWLQRQREALEKSTGEERKTHLDRYVRIENIGALHELGEKYAIPREQMVKSGLAFIGYPGGPRGQFRPPEGERRPEGRPPVPPGPPGERRTR